ncbi:SUF system NifU family Fe-S cluster assembly protein [Candidatus Woesearchaeota archaeon]|nr:SUF system NifU family Fe-S cluster assembly protein [Candidatus Woesearchaeota archaeon]MBI2130153.1 SUF system NifU family Fe-S cluster assembly protein [Candidatus Woesearchaeota archaeon]MBI2660666.1 SUF system NifU family Fe-S cluster assembly protein [Candidatus Woesearchaeota archaeon]
MEMMYQENILEHFKAPHNHGRMESATTHHHEYNPLCGDEIDLYLVIENGIVKDVKFFGRGCAISQASASMLTDAIKGKKIEELKKLTKDSVTEMIGIPLSAVRLKCALLSLDTLRSSIKIFENYITKNGH